MEKIQELVAGRQSFKLRFDDCEWLPVAFQQKFWKLMEYLNSKEVGWYLGAEATDIHLTHQVLHNIRTRKCETVVLEFGVRERYEGYQMDEETEELTLVIDMPYCMWWHTEASDNDYLFEDFEEFQEGYVDTSDLANKWN